MFETKIYYLGLILAVGGYAPSNKKTELLETTTSTWELLNDYPIDERDFQFYKLKINFILKIPLKDDFVNDYAMLSVNEVFYVIGGYTD